MKQKKSNRSTFPFKKVRSVYFVDVDREFCLPRDQGFFEKLLLLFLQSPKYVIHKFPGVIHALMTAALQHYSEDVIVLFVKRGKSR